MNKVYTMDQSLYDAFLLWEKEHLGSHGVDLQNRAFLQSPLEWLNRYLCDINGPSEDESHLGLHQRCRGNFKDIPTTVWANFPAHLYLKADKSLFSQISSTLTQFFQWFELKQPQMLEISMAKGAFQTAYKNIDRLIKIHRHFNERQKNWVYVPHPTESLEDIEFNEQLTQLQAPQASECIEDTFKLISKHPELPYGYFKAMSSKQALVVRLDAKLQKLLESGDQLPLGLMGSQGGAFYLNHIGYPVLQDWT